MDDIEEGFGAGRARRRGDRDDGLRHGEGAEEIVGGGEEPSDDRSFPDSPFLRQGFFDPPLPAATEQDAVFWEIFRAVGGDAESGAEEEPKGGADPRKALALLEDERLEWKKELEKVRESADAAIRGLTDLLLEMGAGDEAIAAAKSGKRAAQEPTEAPKERKKEGAAEGGSGTFRAVASNKVSRRSGLTLGETIAAFRSPRGLYEFLDANVYGQEAAKRAAATALWNHARGSARNSLFVGPTGCGKAEIFRQVARLWSPVVFLDGARLTGEGWKGGVKISSAFDGLTPEEAERAIVVIDEADKFFEPATSSADEDETAGGDA